MLTIRNRFEQSAKLRDRYTLESHIEAMELMFRIGIQTQSYFTKAFKKEFNQTPTQFMQGIRKY